MADVTIKLAANDQASPKINELKKSLTGLVSSGGMAGNILGGMIGGGMMGVATAAISAAAAIPQMAGELANAAAQAERTEASFVALASGVGQSSQQMLASMRRYTSGTVADTDLMLAANRAMMLGVSDNAAEMGQLMAAAIERGRALGVSSQQAVNDVITGIGRMSPMILDNLGIVGVTQSIEDYAKSLGKTSEALSDVEKKQALVNAVIASGSGMAVKGDAVSASERLAASQANAAVAVGGVLIAPMTNFNQSLTDMIDILTGKFDEVAVMAREYQDFITAGTGGDNTAGMQAFVEATNALGVAVQNNLPSAEYYRDILADLGTQAGTGGDFGAAQIGMMRGMVDDVTNSLEALKEAKKAAAQEQLVYELDSLVAYAQETRKLENAFNLNKTAAQNAAVGLDALSMVAASGALDVARLEAAVRNLNNAMAGMSPILSSITGARHAAISRAENLGMQAIGQGADPSEVTAMVANASDAIWNMGLSYDATTEAQFANKIAVESQLDPLQSLTDKLTEADRAAAKLASGGLTDAEKAFGKLKDRVSSMLQESLSPGVSIPEGLVPRQDEANENARRVAAIANEGIGDQTWMEEFKREAPGIFDEIISAADPKAAAAKIFTEFQAGLRPELIDKEVIKQRIRDAIIGENNMAALATEIATELAAEMGTSLPEALAATQEAMGIKPTGGAGATGEGFVEGVDGAQIAATSLGKIAKAFLDNEGKVRTSGAVVGAWWGEGFMAVVGDNVPPGLLEMMTAKLLPYILAALANAGSTSGTDDGN